MSAKVDYYYYNIMSKASRFHDKALLTRTSTQKLAFVFEVSRRHLIKKSLESAGSANARDTR